MKQRHFIKVVATCITGIGGGRLVTTTARGIVVLKQGQSVIDFATQFLNDRSITSFQLHERYDGSWATSPMMFLNHEPKQVLTFMFKQFDQCDLGFHAKDLADFELDRDMRPIKKLITGG
jgi:hypothetical protein